MDTDHSRGLLLDLYQAALAAVSGRRVVRAALSDLPAGPPLQLVAIGKAAAAMARGAHEALGERIAHGLVVTKYGHAQVGLPYETLEAGHPSPDAASLAAGARLLGLVDASPCDTPFLFLLSGGASALVEALPPGLGLAELQRVNRWLLGSGLDIAAMNRVRKGLSLLKGGRLARRLAPRPCLCLCLSDVAGDDPRVIGSGPLVAEVAGPLPALPDWLGALLGRVPAPPLATDPCFARVETRVIAGNRQALAAASARARGLGWAASLHPTLLTGAVEQVAAAVAAAGPGLHLWGGEPTVALPPAPGRGGRNQHLALLLARQLAGQGFVLLSAGSDGSDGPTEDAGALVDGDTLARGDPHYPGGASAALAAYDSGTYLEQSGDLLHTGPTGTNVMDLVMLYREEGC